MKSLNTILLSSLLSVTLLVADKSKDIINYDKINGFIYYSDGSVDMINDNPAVEKLEMINETPAIEELEMAQTIPLTQPIITHVAEVKQAVVASTPKPTQIHTAPTPTISKKQKNKNGKFVGNIKLLHVLDGKDNGYDTTTGSTYYVTGGYETAEVNGISAKVTGYVVGDTGLTDTDEGAKLANGQFMGKKTKDNNTVVKTKANIQEAYLKYKNKNLKAQVGHFRLNTPMTKNSVSTVPNLYEGAMVTSKALLDDTIVIGSHITKMAYGARAISDWSRIGEKTDTAGAVKVYGDANIETLAGDETLPVKIRRGKFVNFGEISNIDNTAGMTIVGGINKSIKNTTIQAWEYFIYDVANITYIDGMAKFKLTNGVNTMVGAQIMHQNIKDTDGNPTLFGLKAAASYKGAKLILAVNKSNGDAMMNLWGGDPAYTSKIEF